MGERLSDDLTFIPNAALEADRWQTDASAWADSQRASVARMWADDARAQADAMAAEFYPFAPGPGPTPGMGDVRRSERPEPGYQYGGTPDAWEDTPLGRGMGAAGDVAGRALQTLGDVGRYAGAITGATIANVSERLGNQDARQVPTEEEISQQRIRANPGLPLNPRAAPIAGAIARGISAGAPEGSEIDPFDFARTVRAGEEYAERNPSGEFAAELAFPLQYGTTYKAAGALGMLPAKATLGIANKLGSMGDAERAAAAARAAGKGVAAAGADAPRRFYHGTNADFIEPDPSKFQSRELFGPGYYMSSDPRAASNYATEGRAAESIAGPNVRPVDVGANARLLDDSTPLPAQEINHISAIVKANASPEDYATFMDELPLPREATGAHIWSALHLAGIRQGDATALLEKAGYDGILHAGGQNRPLLDEAGAAISHQNLVIFPNSLSKLTNPLSGGVASVGGARAVGAALGVAGRRQWKLLNADGDVISVRPDPPNTRWQQDVANNPGWRIEDEMVPVGDVPTPRTLYHGTDATITADALRPVTESVNSMGFLGDAPTTRHGVFLSESQEFAAEYGKNVMPIEANLKKTAVVSEWKDEFIETLDPSGADRDIWGLAKYQRKDWAFFENELGERFTAFLRAKGFDSAEFPELVTTKAGDEIESTTVVVLDPKAIKAANMAGPGAEAPINAVGATGGLAKIAGLSGESAPAASTARSIAQPPALPGQISASADIPPSRRSPQSFGEAPPSFGEAPPLPESIPPKAAGFERFWNRARNVIEHQGPAGKELAGRLREMRDLAETTAGDWVGRMPTVRELSGIEFKNFVNAAEGKVKPGNERVAQAVAEWAGVRDEIYGAARNAGMDVGFIQDYFPHTYDPKLFEGKKNWNANIQHLIQSGQAEDMAGAEQILRRARSAVRDRRYGNLEERREVDLPGYERTKDALFGYVEGSAGRLAQVRTLGEEDALGLRLISEIGAQGYDAKAAKDLMDISTRARTYDRDMSNVSNALRSWNVVTKLGLGALTNSTQSLNTATVTGGLRTLLNTPKAAFSREAKDFALNAGITLDGVIRDLREGGGWAGKAGKWGAPGFGTVEKFNRTLAAWAGKGYAEDMARKAVGGDQGASEALQTMGLNAAAIAKRGGVLSEAEQIRAARNIVERTQFKVDPQDLPGWVDHPAGKIVAQFRTFSYNQSAFVKRELVDPAMKGDARPLIRFLVYGLPVGATVVELQDFLRNRPSEEDPVQAIRQYYQRVGGLGVLGDVLAGLAPRNSKYLPGERYALQAAGTAFGPSMSTLLEGAGSIPGALQGKPENLQRFALKQIPVVGPTIKNTLLPYKPGGRGGTSAGDGQTPAQRYLQEMKGSNPAREYYKRQQAAGR